MHDMTTVKTASEDSLWPGEFDSSNEDNLFCVTTTANTPAVYVMMPADALAVPDWISKSYMILKNGEVGSETNQWTEWTTEYTVYWRPLNGDNEPCFGLNGISEFMYTVAFGDLPPTKITTFDPNDPGDAGWTNDFELRDGKVKLNFVDGAAHDVWISGELTAYIGFTKTVLPITIEFHTDLSNFRFTAKDVEITSFAGAVSSAAPTETPPALLAPGASREVAANFKCDFTFSTFDEDMGMRLKTQTNLIMVSTPVASTMQVSRANTPRPQPRTR